jgi:phosphoglycerol transferase MdoB-like AlkP superfamily enzyme
VFHQLPGRIKRSLFTQLKELGYRTIVVYPVPGFFLNARQFYKSIGVDEFEDPVSLGVGQGWDWKIPDSKFYDAALKKADETPEQPVAVFLLTINQHGPHDTDRPFADYLSRFEASDRAYADFLDKLKARKHRAGVVAFGDHQPEFTKFLFQEEAPRQLTHYEIRCVNFACVGEPKKRVRDDQLDITRLAPTALEHFGFDMDDLSFYGKYLFEECAADVTRCAENLRLKFNRAFAATFQ